MGNEIHAIQKKDGSFLYRHYSTTSDMYTTPTLTEEEMSLFLLYDIASDSLSSLRINPLANIHERLQRARENGTSFKGDTRTLNKWEERPQDYWGDRFAKEKTKEAFLVDISTYLAAPLSEHISSALSSHPSVQGRDLFCKKTKEARSDQVKINGLVSLLSGK